MERRPAKEVLLLQFIVNGLIAGAEYSLLAVGFSLLFSTARFYAFTYGFCYAAGAYGALALREWTGCSLVVAMGGGCLVAVACGAGLDLAVYRHMRRRNASALTLMLASIGAYVVLQNSLSILFGDATRSLREWPVQAGYELAGAHVTGVQVCLAAASVVLTSFVATFMVTTRLGRCMKAVASDVWLSKCHGIDSDVIILIAACMASLLAGAAGVLVGLDVDLTPTMGFRALLVAMVACIIGGIGRLRGPIVGGFALGFVVHLAVWKISSQWQDAIAFAILIIVLVIRPHGYLGSSPKRTTV